MQDGGSMGQAALLAESGKDLIRPLGDLSRLHAGEVGVKAAHLGELLRAGFRVPPGFLVMPEARQLGSSVLREVLSSALDRLGAESVAVRSSGVLEDSASASYAGVLETLTDVGATGEEGAEAVHAAVEAVWRSAGSDTALSYRRAVGRLVRDGAVPERAVPDGAAPEGAAPGGAAPEDTATEGAASGDVVAPVAVVVQQMVTGEYAGVAFSLDPVTGESATILIEVVRGPGAGLVGGRVQPRRFRLSTADLDPSVTPPTGRGSEPVLQAAHTVRDVRDHFGTPVDVEWCWDRGTLHVLQARPVTSRTAMTRPADPSEDQGSDGDVPQSGPTATAGAAGPEPVGEVVLRGEPASPGVAHGPVRVLGDVAEIDAVQDGDILVTQFTSPEWLPALVRAAGLVTEVGGVTSHAAIVSRELGLPCVVGAERAREVLAGADPVTVDGRAGTVSRR